MFSINFGHGKMEKRDTSNLILGNLLPERKSFVFLSLSLSLFVLFANEHKNVYNNKSLYR